jgi:hypothetical protein
MPNEDRPGNFPASHAPDSILTGWKCDECLEEPGGENCVRPDYCDVSREHLIERADMLRKEMHERGEL